MKNVETLDSIDNLQDLLSFPLTDLLPYYIYAINEDAPIKIEAKIFIGAYFSEISK